MDVIGHDHPRRQPITLAVETQQHLLDSARRARVLEHTLAVAEIKVGFELRALLPFIFDFKQRLPLMPTGYRHGVRQPERQHLQRAGLVVVRQIAAGVPAFGTNAGLELSLGRFERAFGDALARHGRPHAPHTRREDIQRSADILVGQRAVVLFVR